MEVVQRTAAHTSYTPGTPAYEGALYQDYQAGLVTPQQYQSYATSGLAPSMQPTSAWSSFWSGLENAGDILLSGYTKYQLMENQKDMLQLEAERQRTAMVSGMMGEGAVPSYGGINVYTLLMFAGIGLLAMILLKKR